MMVYAYGGYVLFFMVLVLGWVSFVSEYLLQKFINRCPPDGSSIISPGLEPCEASPAEQENRPHEQASTS